MANDLPDDAVTRTKRDTFVEDFPADLGRGIPGFDAWLAIAPSGAVERLRAKALRDAHLVPGDVLDEAIDGERKRWRSAMTRLHAPFRIYDECGHDHTEDDLIRESAIEVDVIGYTCEDGFEYEICVACCCDSDSEQTEECVASHHHGAEMPRCQTMKRLADLLEGRTDGQ